MTLEPLHWSQLLVKKLPRPKLVFYLSRFRTSGQIVAFLVKVVTSDIVDIPFVSILSILFL